MKENAYRSLRLLFKNHSYHTLKLLMLQFLNGIFSKHWYPLQTLLSINFNHLLIVYLPTPILKMKNQLYRKNNNFNKLVNSLIILIKLLEVINIEILYVPPISRIIILIIEKNSLESSWLDSKSLKIIVELYAGYKKYYGDCNKTKKWYRICQ